MLPVMGRRPQVPEMLSVLLLVVAAGLMNAAAAPTKKPNFMILFADGAWRHGHADCAIVS